MKNLSRVGVVVAVTLLTVCCALWRAFCAMRVWKLLPVKAFGFAPYDYKHALVWYVAIVMLGSLVGVIDTVERPTKTTEEALQKFFGVGFLTPLFILASSWIFSKLLLG